MKKVRPDPAGIPDRNTYGELRDHAMQINALVSIFGSTLPAYADDAAAATGGIVIGGFYRTGSVIKQRVA